MFSYHERFQELTLICTKFVDNEKRRLTSTSMASLTTFMGTSNLPDRKTLDKTIELDNDTCWIRNFAPTHKGKSNTKGKADDSSRNHPWSQATTFMRQNVAQKREKRGNASGNPNANVVHSNGRRSSVDSLSRVQKAQEYMAKGCQIFLAQISTKKEEDKLEGKQIKGVPIVRDFPEVFPEDLPALPLARPVEFQIDLIPGAAPVARALVIDCPI
ncbi:hypothetical protein Tco_0519489 [Tanacetum coccineum]